MPHSWTQKLAVLSRSLGFLALLIAVAHELKIARFDRNAGRGPKTNPSKLGNFLSEGSNLNMLIWSVPCTRIQQLNFL